MNKFSDILKICRLCLVEEKVNHAIFEESGDLRSIFLKISSCLPVSVNKDDGLPEKICDTCSTKLESFYQFWNETANAEKQLLHWLSVNKSLKQNQIADTSKRMETPEVKQEEVDPIDMSSDAQTYILQQQQLPYAAAATDSVNTSESEEPVSKRPRRASAVKALEQMESEDEDDPDNYAKSETDESEKDEEEEETNYQENPSTTSVEDQPGPSGLASKKMVLDDTPSLKPKCEVFLDEDKDNTSYYEKKYTSSNDQNEQSEQQHDSKKFFCAECKIIFTCSYGLKLHSETHLETKRFKCSLCEKSFLNYQYLGHHMHFIHKQENIRHQCTCCNKSYNTLEELRFHCNEHKSVLNKCDKRSEGSSSDMNLTEPMADSTTHGKDYKGNIRCLALVATILLKREKWLSDFEHKHEGVKKKYDISSNRMRLTKPLVDNTMCEEYVGMNSKRLMDSLHNNENFRRECTYSYSYKRLEELRSHFDNPRNGVLRCKGSNSVMNIEKPMKNSTTHEKDVPKNYLLKYTITKISGINNFYKNVGVIASSKVSEVSTVPMT